MWSPLQTALIKNFYLCNILWKAPMTFLLHVLPTKWCTDIPCTPTHCCTPASFPTDVKNLSMLIIQWTDCMTIVTFRRWLENVMARCWNTHFLVIFHWNDVKISRYVQKTISRTTTWNILNFLISRTFKIKDFKGHYLKLVVLQDYTQFAFTNIVISRKKYFWGSTAHH